MSTLYSVRASNIRRETPDCVSIEFDMPDDLKQKFSYMAGQHVIVRKVIDGEDVRRTYSFCSAPSGNEHRIAVRQVEGGVFSTFANQNLEAGDELEISMPMGDFFLKTEASRAANYVAFAAGSGITPIIAMIKEVLAREPQSRFFLYYGNRDVEHTVFAEEIADLKNMYMGRFSFQLFLTRQAVDLEFFNGRITGEKVSVLHGQTFSRVDVEGYYLCGPQDMVNDVTDALTKAGEPEENIHSELFFLNTENAAQPGEQKSAKEGLAESKIKIIADGDEVELDYSDEHGSILEAALQAGVDVSFACKGGVCATCRAKVIKGKVDMAINYGLEPEEIDDGFVLTCQSVPLTEGVVISFDE